MWVSLVFVDFSKLYVYVCTKTFLQIGLNVSQFIFHGLVGIRLGFLRFQEDFELVNAVLCFWLQSPLDRESFVLSDICVCFMLALRLLSPVLIRFELGFRRSQAGRQFFDFYFFLGTK